MTTQCSTARCGRKARGYSHRCSRCTLKIRRWGHVDATPLGAFEMRKVIRHVRGLIDAKPNREELWKALIAAHDAVMREAATEARMLSEGRAITTAKTRLNACKAIVETGREAQAEDIVLNAVAIGYLASAIPKRFYNADCYFMAMAVRFRRLNRSVYLGHMSATTGRVHYVSPEFRPREQMVIGRMLAAAFAGFGMKLHEVEGVELKRKANVMKTPMMLLDAV